MINIYLIRARFSPSVCRFAAADVLASALGPVPVITTTVAVTTTTTFTARAHASVWFFAPVATLAVIAIDKVTVAAVIVALLGALARLDFTLLII